MISVTRLVGYAFPFDICTVFDLGHYKPEQIKEKAELGNKIHEEIDISKHIKSCMLNEYTEIYKEYAIKDETMSGRIDYLLYNPKTDGYIIIDIKTSGYESSKYLSKEDKNRVSLQVQLYHRLIGYKKKCRKFVLHITKEKERMIEIKEYPKEEYKQILIILNTIKKWKTTTHQN